MDELLQLVLRFMQQIEQNVDDLDDAESEQIATFLQEVIGFIQEQQQTGLEDTIQPELPQESPNVQSLNGVPPNATAQLLWILGGQNVDAFIHYLGNFPDPQAKQLLSNPEELDRVIRYLHTIMPPGEQPSLDNIPHADINSSNIYGFRYDPKSGHLRVRFQSGAVYGYDGVPAGVFNMFKQGAIPAKTNGQNNFGRWWTGKMPSLGAAFYELIRQGDYPYRKISG